MEKQDIHPVAALLSGITSAFGRTAVTITVMAAFMRVPLLPSGLTGTFPGFVERVFAAIYRVSSDCFGLPLLEARTEPLCFLRCCSQSGIDGGCYPRVTSQLSIRYDLELGAVRPGAPSAQRRTNGTSGSTNCLRRVT